MGGKRRPARDRKITAGQRLTAGFLIAGIAGLAFLAGEVRFALFTVGAVFFPYLAFIAPFRCNNPTRDRLPCRHTGWGLLIGCGYHRLDTVRRIVRRHPDQRPRAPRPAPGRAQVARSGAIPAPAVGTVTFRRKVFDVVGLLMTTLGTVAGWLALFVSPG
jgi:hypothetical protein